MYITCTNLNSICHSQNLKEIDNYATYETANYATYETAKFSTFELSYHYCNNTQSKLHASMDLYMKIR